MQTNQPRTVALNDLGQLTMRANIAFAVRCAQRIRPCFRLPANAPRRRELTATVDRAIRVAAAFCQGITAEPGLAASAASAVFRVAEETGEFTSYAGYAALRAAEAAAYAEGCTTGQKDCGRIDVVAAAFGAGRVLCANADGFALPAVADAMYADMVKLQNAEHGTYEDLGPPVDPSESGPLGPLWPAGAPACFGGSVQSGEE